VKWWGSGVEKGGGGDGGGEDAEKAEEMKEVE
jgi:hypothetical protein